MAAAASQAELRFSSEPVTRSLDALANRDIDFLQHVKTVSQITTDVASTLFALGQVEKVPSLRSLYKDQLSLENEVNMHIQSLQSLKRTYTPSSTATDFGPAIEEKAMKLMKQSKFDPEKSAQLKDFDKQTGGVQEQEEEDEEVVDTSASDLKNEKCPLTMKSVFDLTEPVEDLKGFIYEKQAVLNYIRDKSRSGQTVACPISGARHTITQQGLRPATRIERLKRNAKYASALQARGGAVAGTRGGRPVHDVDK